MRQQSNRQEIRSAIVCTEMVGDLPDLELIGQEGDTLRTLLAALKRFTKRDVCNTVALRRQVADAAIEQVGYPLG